MPLAALNQHFQDWLTQQWVILFGAKIDKIGSEWLIGPFGTVGKTGKDFVTDLAENEKLTVSRSNEPKGLLSSIAALNLSQEDTKRLHPNVIEFYERTSEFDIQLRTSWNRLFKTFGFVLNFLFSRRIQQLNIPWKSSGGYESLDSSIINLVDAQQNDVQHTIWLRINQSTKQVVYSGVYGTCTLPSGCRCIKAVFPLPNGNATVILKPSVNQEGALILDASGAGIGDAGFYFLLEDEDGNTWTKYIRKFKDTLVVTAKDDQLKARQKLSLWGIPVVAFDYLITPKAQT